MKKLDKLPKEYFVLLQKDMPEFSRGQFWRVLFLIAIFGFFLNPGLLIEIPIVKCVVYIFLTIMLLWIMICIFFSSKDTLMHHKLAYIILNIVGLALFRITFLQMLAMLSATMYCNNWDCPDPIVVYIMYGVACLVLLEELVVNILLWKYTKKFIIAGEFKENGNGFFGENNKRKDDFFGIVTCVCGGVMVLSLICIPLGRILGFFGVYIDGHDWFVPIIGLYFAIYHALLYIFAYGDSRWLAQFYYVKRFEQSTSEFKEDKEYGIGFAFTRVILAVILIIALFIFVVKIGQII